MFSLPLLDTAENLTSINNQVTCWCIQERLQPTIYEDISTQPKRTRSWAQAWDKTERMCSIFQQLLQYVASCSSLRKSPSVQFLFPPVNLWKVASHGLGRRYSKTNGNIWLRPLSEGNGSACMFYDNRLCSNSASDTKLLLPHFCHFIYELSTPTLGKHCRISNS